VYRPAVEGDRISYTSDKLLILGYQSSRTRSFSRGSKVYVSHIDLPHNDTARQIHTHVSLFLGHGEKLHDVPDEYLEDSLILAKKIAVAAGFENYNILQARV